MTRSFAHLALIGLVAGIHLADHPAAAIAVALGVGLVGELARGAGPPLAVVLVALLAGGVLQHRAVAGIDRPPPESIDGWIMLLDDPRPSGPVGMRATVRIGHDRVAATAHGGAAGRLDDAQAGEWLRVEGTLRPVAAGDERSLRRHIVARLTITSVGDRRAGSPVTRTANAVRQLLRDGARSLGDDTPVYLGMVIGDDRGQSPVTADDFRAAGLGHLLVVSGQNVAFVIAVAMPVAGRLRPGGRAVVLLGVIAFFAFVTRFEPSVLRASMMAGVGIGAAALGRPVDGRVALSSACGLLLMIDPFLVGVLAFQLSAAATGGIVWFGAPLAERLGGPRWLAVPAATTIAAQLAVAPLLLGVFGPMPLAALPANLAAGPISGAVMIWGCTGGLVAGFADAAGFSAVAELLQWPTTAMLWWITGVARLAAAGPEATVGAWGSVALALAIGAWVSGRVRRALPALVAAAVVGSAIVGAPHPTDGWTSAGNGVEVIHGDGRTVLVLDDPVSAQGVLESTRRLGVRAVDAVIARDGDRADADAVLALRARFGAIAVAAPPLHRVPSGRTVAPDQRIEIGGLRIIITAVDPRLDVAVLASVPDG